jgi:hypothetical protein
MKGSAEGVSKSCPADTHQASFLSKRMIRQRQKYGHASGITQYVFLNAVMLQQASERLHNTLYRQTGQFFVTFAGEWKLSCLHNTQ